MLVANLPLATTSLINKSIETPVSKFGLTLKFPFSPYISMLGPDLLAQLGTMKIKAIVQDGQNTHNILPDMLVKDLVEIASSNEGTMAVETDAPFTECRFYGTVELSEQGAIYLGNTTKMLLSITDKPTTFELDVYAIDHPVITEEVIYYDNRSINGGGEVEVNVEDNTIMCLPRTDLQEIQITYPTRTCIYHPDELRHILHDTNELSGIFGHGYVKSGAIRFLCLDVSNALRVKLRYASTQTAYFLKNIHINKV